MTIKGEAEIIKNIVKKFLSKQDNLYKAERLFIASSVVRWIFASTKSKEEILGYLMQVERYLQNEIDLYWSDGVIKIGKKRSEP